MCPRNDQRMESRAMPLAAGIRLSCRPGRRGRAAVAATLLLGAALACTGPDDAAGRRSAAGKSGELRYLVRGEVVQVPPRVSEASPLMIRHEAIPDWVNRAGQPVGMEAMTMGFTLAPGGTATDLTVGDKIEFTLRVDWERNSYEISDLKKLPADTPLRFGSGEPAGRSEPR